MERMEIEDVDIHGMIYSCPFMGSIEISVKWRHGEWDFFFLDQSDFPGQPNNAEMSDQVILQAPLNY